MEMEVKLEHLAPQRLLVCKVTCEHSAIGSSFAQAMTQIRECLRQAGAEMSTPVAVYLAWRETDCDMAVGYPISQSITPANGCETLDLPGGPHASVLHLGPYSSLAQTHSAIRDWCAANGHKLVGPCWESYRFGPFNQPDATKWETTVNYPVAS